MGQGIDGIEIFKNKLERNDFLNRMAANDF